MAAEPLMKKIEVIQVNKSIAKRLAFVPHLTYFVAIGRSGGGQSFKRHVLLHRVSPLELASLDQDSPEVDA